MAMTFRFGPNSWCDEAHAKTAGYSRYIPTALDLAREKALRDTQKAPRLRQPSTPPVTRTPRQVPGTAARPVTQGKSLPAAPAIDNMHPTMLDPGACREEFDALWQWMEQADAAPGKFTVRQQITRDTVGERIDALRWYIWA